MKFRTLVGFMLLVLTTQTLAWWDSGHEMVTQIAWSRLSPDDQKSITRLLKSHPDPEVRDLVTASIWPDTIKQKDHPFHHFERGTWHYQNHPVETDAVGTPDSGELLTALGQNISILSDKSRPADERAVALSWVAHLVGDIHQPLHNSGSFRPEFLPRGDEGGNRYKVQLDGREISLHVLWDSLGGRFLRASSPTRIANYLALFTHRFPPSSFQRQLEVLDPTAWSAEGLEAARMEAYALVEPGAPLSDEAYQRVLDTTARQIPLAGYRLAEVLQRSI